MALVGEAAEEGVAEKGVAEAAEVVAAVLMPVAVAQASVRWVQARTRSRRLAARLPPSIQRDRLLLVA